QRPGLRAVARRRAAHPPHRRQLPGLRAQAGDRLMPAVPGMQGGQVPPLVLFDLDGTLLDSAPDFVATIAVLRSRRGRASMPESQLRPHVSRGSRAMLAAAFPDLDEDAREALVQPFLDIYRRELAHHGAPFAGAAELLHAIAGAGGRWGIVLN